MTAVLPRNEIALARRTLRGLTGGGGTNLFSDVDSDPKTRKSNKRGRFLTRIQYFAPAKISGHEVCASRSPGCTIGCLHTAGVPFQMPGKERSRIGRTQFYFKHRDLYRQLLVAEVSAHVYKSKALGLRPAVRLNGTSDIVWERVFPELFGMFPTCKFYDYTKHVKRMLSGWKLPRNYYLTFSRSEANDAECDRILTDNRHARIAVVFNTTRTKPLPKWFAGHKVVDGDLHDERFEDRGGRIVGLRAKGKARLDDSGFVVDTLR